MIEAFDLLRLAQLLVTAPFTIYEWGQDRAYNDDLMREQRERQLAIDDMMIRYQDERLQNKK